MNQSSVGYTLKELAQLNRLKKQNHKSVFYFYTIVKIEAANIDKAESKFNKIKSEIKRRGVTIDGQ